MSVVTKKLDQVEFGEKILVREYITDSRGHTTYFNYTGFYLGETGFSKQKAHKIAIYCISKETYISVLEHYTKKKKQNKNSE